MPKTTDYKDRKTAKYYLLEDLPTQYISYKEELSLNLNKSLEHTLELPEEISSGEVKEEKLIFKYGTQIVYGDIELSKLDLELFKLDDDKDYCLIDDDIWYIDYDNKRIMRCRDKIVVIKKEREEIKTMENTTRVRTVKSLIKDIHNKKIDLNHLVQRQSNQWNKKQKNLLIDSLLKGIVLQPVIFCKIDDKLYCVDGKQRLTTLREYVYEVDKDGRFTGETNKNFEKLSEEEQSLILDSEISTITYTNISDDEIFELFQRYNNGVSLTGGQKTRSYCDKEVLDVIHRHLPQHEITNIWNITKGQLSKNEDEMVVFQSMMLLDGFEYKNFSNKEVERFLQETSKEELLKLYDIVNDNMDKIFDYLVDKDGEIIKYKNLKKIHLPMIISSYQDTDTWKNKLSDFLENYSSENSEYDEYRSHCTTGTSQKEHVQGRLGFWNN